MEAGAKQAEPVEGELRTPSKDAMNRSNFSSHPSLKSASKKGGICGIDADVLARKSRLK